jgi:hypothetical protein
VAAANEGEATAKLVRGGLEGEADGDLPMLAAANAEDGWLRLTPFGRFPNSAGMQIVTQDAGTRMANAMNDAVAKVKKAFAWFAGANAAPPIYLGHPDHAHFATKEGHRDKTVFGHVTALENRADGIWANLQWSDAGKQLLQAGKKLFLSPHWNMLPLANSEFMPAELLSIGLTPNPNIRGAAAANQQPSTTMNEYTKKILAALKRLGFSDAQIASAANATSDGQTPAGAPTPEEVETKISTLLTNAANATELQTQLTEATRGKTQAETDLTTARTNAANAQKAHTKTLLDHAVEQNRITPGERGGWEKRFETDFVPAANALADIKGKARKDTPASGNLGAANEAQTSAANAIQVEADRRWELEMAKKPGRRKTWAQIWGDVKADPKFAGQFKNMEASAEQTI